MTQDDRITTQDYYRRERADFYREANILDGAEPETASSRPPADLAKRKWVVFGGVGLLAVVVFAVSFFLFTLPSCQNPPVSWLPCFP